MSSGERRRMSRRRISLKVRFSNEEFEARGFSENLSTSGMFVETKLSLPPGTRLHVEIELDGKPFFCECSVVRCVRADPNVAPVIKGGASGSAF